MVLPAHSTAGSTAAFSSTVDHRVIEIIALATPITQIDLAIEPASLRWTDVEILDRQASRAFERCNVAIDFKPRYSYDSMPETVMTNLEFSGMASFSDGRRLRIDQDNAGAFFARALFVRETRRVKFLLPATFTNQETTASTYGNLAFECNAVLSDCDSPRLVFSKGVDRKSGWSMGLPGVTESVIPFPNESSEASSSDAV
jgi:hypothetical protein